jgi:2-polyprenyl-3-methyl-5-hydroxy-6-metoxy-1,4-benzoquinol methylase
VASNEKNQDSVKKTSITDTEFWDDQWNQRFRKSLAQSLLHGRDFGRNGAFLKLIGRHVGVESIRGKNVLELGGAASNFLLDFALFADAKVTAVDSSQVGISRTRQMFQDNGVHGAAILADIFKHEVAPSSFDVVCHWGLLEHFTDPLPVLLASSRPLRANGRLIFTMPNMAAIGAKLWSRTAPANYSKHVFHSDEEIESALHRSGLRLEKKFYFGPPLFRMAPPERPSMVAAVANLGHIFVCAFQTAFPSAFTTGWSAISSCRGFIALKT